MRARVPPLTICLPCPGRPTVETVARWTKYCAGFEKTCNSGRKMFGAKYDNCMLDVADMPLGEKEASAGNSFSCRGQYTVLVMIG